MHLKLIEPISSKKRAWKRVALVPLSILQIAGLTPPEVEVSITDEKFDKIDFNEKIDLVGISLRTTSSARGYEIADEYRKRGKKVVLGGIHPTILPNEAIQHADAVLIGEAENIWYNLLRDFQKGTMMSFYKAETFPNLQSLPCHRRDLLKSKKYMEVYSVQFSRGCVYKCNFCIVSKFFGGKYRFRPVDDVIQEISNVKSKYLFFIDDNIAGNLRYTEKLLNSIIPFKKKWVGQITITAARNENFVKLLAESGCISIFIGFESLSEKSLKESSKHHNKLKYYKEAIKNLKKYGIILVGAFVFGFDSDDKYTFERTADFGYKNKIGVMNFNILTPYPGTELYQSLKNENRLLSKRWWLTDNWDDVLFEPKLMSKEELLDGCNMLHKEFATYSSLLKRAVLPHHNLIYYWLIYLRSNLTARRMNKDFF